jgi:hypothetical protein
MEAPLMNNDFKEVVVFLEDKKPKPKKKTPEEEAKSKGLTHLGMGRFGDGKSISHILHKGKLVNVHKPPKVKDEMDYTGKRRVTVEVQKEHPLESVRSDKEVKQLDKTLRDYNKEFVAKLDNDHKDSIGHLISGKLDTALSTFKRGQNPRDGETQKKIGKLDEVMKKSKTPISMSVFRPTNMDNFEKGKSYEYSGYLHTTLDPKEIEKHGKHLLHIEIPKGHPGIYNDRKAGKEYILPRRSQIHIVSDPVAISVPDFDKKGGITSPTLLWKAIVVHK